MSTPTNRILDPSTKLAVGGRTGRLNSNGQPTQYFLLPRNPVIEFYLYANPLESKIKTDQVKKWDLLFKRKKTLKRVSFSFCP